MVMNRIFNISGLITHFVLKPKISVHIFFKEKRSSSRGLMLFTPKALPWPATLMEMGGLEKITPPIFKVISGHFNSENPCTHSRRCSS